MTATSQYEIHLTRYKNGQRRQSAACFTQAVDFDDAVKFAQTLVQGSRDADPDAEFEIASVTATGLGGPTCEYAWVTEEELADQRRDHNSQ